ncbi:MAG: hypothetical protein LVQ63_00085 [Thermoplasmatales archaeon]|nr:hypothetical protein [Thermoplasmatales archaeon]
MHVHKTVLHIAPYSIEHSGCLTVSKVISPHPLSMGVSASLAFVGVIVDRFLRSFVVES